MSVDGVLLTDWRQTRDEPAFLAIAVTGPKGSGKSLVLRQFIQGATGTQQAEQVYALGDCLKPPSAAPGEKTAEASALTSSSSPPPLLLAVLPKTLNDSYLSRGTATLDANCGDQLRPGTVLIMDDVEALWALSTMNNTVHHLQRLWRLAQRSIGCRVILSSHDEASIPYFFRKDGRPLVHAIPSLTGAAARRMVRAVAAAAPSFSAFDGCGDSLSPSSTRRGLVLAMTMASAPMRDLGNDAAVPHPLAHHLRFVEGDAIDSSTPASEPLFGLDALLDRLGMLISVFATGSTSGAGGALLRSMQPTTGVLLHGPSGCGKSAIAREVSRRYPHIPFTFVTCTGLFSKYLGESEEKLRDVYRAARAMAPSVVVLDEVDVLAQSRQGGGDGEGSGKSSVSVARRMLACLLCELDGIADNSGVLTIATTNAPHVLDNALLRQGRLETLLAVPPLTFEAALAMSQAFFSTFRATASPSPLADVALGTVDALAIAQSCSPQTLAEKVAHRGTGCAATNLHYLLRKILERHLKSLPASQLPAHDTDTDLPMPSAECVQACLFECASVLVQTRYVDPFTR